MNEPPQDLVIEARELVAKATPGPFEVYPIKTMKGDIAGFVWGKYLSDQKDADHFWSSELVPFDDAQMYARAPELLRQMADEVERLREHVKAQNIELESLRYSRMFSDTHVGED